ncbi:MAG TPA: hypothetical protein PLB38_01395 [bacterium]|nr:hypothetical protein [bacterium]
MFTNYYVNINPQKTGEHEVHTENCGWRPLAPNAIFLGCFTNCQDAIKAAKAKGFKNVDGCYYCCKQCHTK